MPEPSDDSASDASIRLRAAGPDLGIVREYGTRYLRITVRYGPDTGFSWLRTPGPAHTRQQRLPGSEIAAALRHLGAAAVDGPGARPVLGEWVTAAVPGGEVPSGVRSGVLYRGVPGAFSVARLLPSADAAAFRLSLGALADAGRMLRRLHRQPWQLTERPPHPGVQRLLDWIRADGTDPAAIRLRELARHRLGSALWDRLRDWAEEAVRPPGQGGAVLLHGAPGIGCLIPAPGGGRTAVLTGEEVTGGDPGLDLGWVLGELHELRAAAASGLGAAGTGPAVDYAAAAHALISGYTGNDRGVPPGTARAATLRLAVHMRDFASFVGWHEDLRHYCDLLAETLVEEGAPALVWAGIPGLREDDPRGPRPDHPARRTGMRTEHS